MPWFSGTVGAQNPAFLSRGRSGVNFALARVCRYNAPHVQVSAPGLPDAIESAARVSDAGEAARARAAIDRKTARSSVCEAARSEASAAGATAG
jgi:hypothetical protein